MKLETNHYVFHYLKDSVAEKEIDNISNLQEGCYIFISNCLGTEAKTKIHYHFFDTPEEVGKQYAIVHNDDDDEPCNGFALPDTMSFDGMNHIYAVYNDKVKCIGFHEDAHIISYSYGRPKSKFIREGLAMYFDRYWWGIDNFSWSKFYLKQGKMPSLSTLFQDSEFDKYSDVITYPLAGAFTSYLIERFGIDQYVKFYKACDIGVISSFNNVFGDIDEIENGFINYLDMIHLRDSIRNLIIEDLSK